MNIILLTYTEHGASNRAASIYKYIYAYMLIMFLFSLPQLTVPSESMFFFEPMCRTDG